MSYSSFLTFFFLVGWSIFAWRKSMSLVCWEMVPSIFTFSWEYTACRKEEEVQRKRYRWRLGLIYHPGPPERHCYLLTPAALF